MPSTPSEYGACFISPHPDDIAFSCYAALRNPLTAHLKFLIITVFDQSLFTFNQNLTGVETISKIRREEDKAFCNANNCDYLSLNLPDSSVRHKNRDTDYTTLPGADPMYETATRELRKVVNTGNLSEIPIYVPLGNSLHLDHLIVRDAVRTIAAEPHKKGKQPSVFYYEDLPYAGNWSEVQLQNYAREILGLNCASLHMDLNRMWNDKVKGCSTYASQIEESTIPTINRHALSVGGGSSRAERIWYLPTRESTAFDSAVDTICWVGWEACRLVGGGGVALQSIISSTEYKRCVRRSLLIGPMYMPRDCVEYDPCEDLDEIACRLNSRVLYQPLGRGCGHEVSPEVYNALREIEFRHGVEVAYLRDSSVDEHVVERLLINLSGNIVPKGIFSPSLRSFLNDLRDKFDLDLPMDNIRYRSPEEVARLSLESLGNRHPFDNRDYNSRTKQAIHGDHGEYGHIDNDYTYGLMMGQPASEAMLAVLSSPHETCLLIAQEYLALPTAYATLLIQPPETVKTMYYAGEVHPLCSLAEGLVLPKPVTSRWSATDGIMWDGQLRALINYINKRNDEQEDSARLGSVGHTGGQRDAFLDIRPFRPLQTHGDVKIIQHAWKLDKTLPLSDNVLDELRFFDRGFSFNIPGSSNFRPGQQIFSHGITPIRNHPQRRSASRIRLLAYARRCWSASVTINDEESWIVLTRISRAVAAKAMHRDLAVVEMLGRLLPQRKILFIIITKWEGRQGAHVIEPLLTEAEKISRRQMNTFIHIVNSFSWPEIPEPGERGTYLTREEIHCAADVNLCLSSYDAYSLSALESLSCGALCVVSMSCGAGRRVQSLGSIIDRNILLVDYADAVERRVAEMVARNATHGEIIKAIFLVSDRENIEASAASDVAQAIADSLPKSMAEQQAQMARGWDLAGKMSWDAEIRKSFIPVVREIFGTSTVFIPAAGLPL